MAYKISYKVVSEQGEQLKNISKDMDNYTSRLHQIISKLGNDELLQSVRGDLNKFLKQLEEEKTILNLAGQVITEVVQSYTGAEKKSVQKVDRAKAHNRDFYKRPVAVASAGGAAAAGGAASAGNATYNATASYTSYQSTTNVFTDGGGAAASAGAASAASSVLTSTAENLSKAGSQMSAGMAAGVAAAAAGVAAAGGGAAGAVIAGKSKKAPEGEG